MAKKKEIKTITGLEFKWEVLLVYLISILGLIFSLMKDKKVDKDVKLQYNQSAVIFIIEFILNIVTRSLSFYGGYIFAFPIYGLEIVIFVFVIIAIVKAFDNESYEIPLISDIAKSIFK